MHNTAVQRTHDPSPRGYVRFRARQAKSSVALRTLISVVVLLNPSPIVAKSPKYNSSGPIQHPISSEQPYLEPYRQMKCIEESILRLRAAEDDGGSARK